MTVADLLSDVLGTNVPVAFRAYDGSSFGPADAATTIVVRSPDALRRIVTAPDELGFGRAYVAGELEVDGDIFDVMAVAEYIEELKLGPRQIAAAARLVGWAGLKPLPPPPEEARLRGRRHSRTRDAAAIAHHYDMSNDFYGMVLGPSLTYSCAVWYDDTTTLEDAQANKHELICRKLGLRPGMRLLDIGCGWGGMLLHAAEHHGVQAVGVTLSRPQAELARKRAAERGLGDLVEVRHADFRDVDDGPFDAISSIGMFEHVGLSQLDRYFERCHSLLRPGGRLVNHGISRPHHAGKMHHHRWAPSFLGRSFTERYVFPDGELHEIGNVISAIQRAGFEARHMESLREHYALTLRCWVRNLQGNWDDAVAEVGEGRARVWLLYMAAAAVGFEHDDNQVHQVLATATRRGASGMPLRPEFT
ncbi:MAG: cyclopropane-fatty-acyl-phospholipid synthase [Actinomycetota bacterium]|jgi:cyclopropane-fatty-acyl-phospholipid synthase|nr:cyclopropane-fatty-acyl-phospholipid synthase [Actinomycetota bacterium]